MSTLNYVPFLCLTVNCCLCAEILRNNGFENPNLTGSWSGWHVTLQSVTDDIHSGKHALKVTGRNYSFQGPGQDISIQPGGRYNFTSYVKQLNDHPRKMFQSIQITIAYTWSDSGKKDYYVIAQHPFVQSADGWFILHGDFTAPVKHFSKAFLYYEGPDPGIDFIVDDASLQHLSLNTNWKTAANARIQKIRKNNINIQVTHDASFSPSDIEIKIDHKRHLFGFGSMVHADWMTNTDYKEYQNFVYDMFNWVTVDTFKWYQNRGTEDQPDYTSATNAVKELKNNGMKVRGHNLFWGVPGKSPEWVENLNGTMLKKTIKDRISYMMRITKGLLDHWDVNNELLHDQLYESKTGDPHYSEKIFDMAHKADPEPKLFLNDYNVVAVGAVTDAYVEQAKDFKKANVGLYGLGIQSHFKLYTPPDPTLMMLRLDRLASVGFPLWVTEMTIENHDEDVRADWYEMALRTYFSHPALEGILLWGFWDHQMQDPYAALINGYSFYVNAAGQRYFDLVKKEWSTHEVHKLSDGSSFTVNGFQGDYDIVVNYKGVPIMYKEFHLGKQDKHLSLHVSGDGSKISLPSTINPFDHVTHPIHLSHNYEHLIGRASSTAQNTDIRCVTRVSPTSAVGDDKSVNVFCQGNEVLTGCSSVLKDGEWYRDGDAIVIHEERIACKAINGWNSKQGVQAVARCCKSKDLKCAYRGSGPTEKTVAAMVETLCQHGELATGCSAWTYQSAMEGAYPSVNHRGCIAQNDGTSGGTRSTAACCSAPSLTCKTMVSKPSGLLRGNTAKVSCEKGYLMTGCNVKASYGKSAGAYIEGTPGQGERCVAINGEDKFKGEEGIRAVAVCCKRDSHGAIIG